MKKIAIFSDIHGNLQALNSILEAIDKEDFDEVICLGDVVGVGPDSKDCLDVIMDSNIKMVKGNHEIYQTNKELAKKLLNGVEYAHKEWVRLTLNDKEMEYLKNLPIEYEELINGQLFTFSHFFLDDTKEYYITLNILGGKEVFDVMNNYETDYMFMGHSHEAFTLKNRGLFTCVGSSGCRKDNVTFYTKVTIDEKNVRIDKKEVLYDRKAFERAVLKLDYPDRERALDFCNIKIKERE